MEFTKTHAIIGGVVALGTVYWWWNRKPEDVRGIAAINEANRAIDTAGWHGLAVDGDLAGLGGYLGSVDDKNIADGPKGAMPTTGASGPGLATRASKFFDHVRELPDVFRMKAGASDHSVADSAPPGAESGMFLSQPKKSPTRFFLPAALLMGGFFGVWWWVDKKKQKELGNAFENYGSYGAY